MTAKSQEVEKNTAKKTSEEYHRDSRIYKWVVAFAIASTVLRLGSALADHVDAERSDATAEAYADTGNQLASSYANKVSDNAARERNIDLITGALLGASAGIFGAEARSSKRLSNLAAEKENESGIGKSPLPEDNPHPAE
jgi:hypothetical protein